MPLPRNSIRAAPGGLWTRLALATVLLVLGACAAKRQPTAEESYTSASEYFESGAYEIAIQEYKNLLDQHPFSEHAEEAEIRIAESYYLMGRYAEAVAAFSDFERMHPTSPKAPAVTYYLGMSYLRQMRPPDRDQSAAANALAYFRAAIDRYPNSPWAARSSLRLRECQESMAGHELYIGRFYLRHRKLLAAEARLEHILRSYPDTDVAAEALLLFAHIYQDENLLEPARLALQAVLVHHPDAPEAAIARRRLQRLPGGPELIEGPEGDDPVRQLLALRRSDSTTPAETASIPLAPAPTLSASGTPPGGPAPDGTEPGGTQPGDAGKRFPTPY